MIVDRRPRRPWVLIPAAALVVVALCGASPPTDPTWPETATAIATVLLAFIALGQVALFFVQLRLMRQGVKDATTAAGAAKKSAEVAERALLAVERPILLIEVEQMPPAFNEPYQIRRAQITVRNIGRQPAINQRCVSEIMPRRKPFVVPKPGVTDFTSDVRIGLDPGQLIAREEPPARFDCWVALDMAEYRRDEVDGWSVGLYLIGVINYTDAIGTEREHGFTFHYIPQPQPNGQWRRFIEAGYNFDRLKEPQA